MARFTGELRIKISTGAYDLKAWEIKKAIMQRAAWEAFGPSADVEYLDLKITDDGGLDPESEAFKAGEDFPAL